MKSGTVASTAVLLGSSFLIGSIPFSNLIARSVAGRDLRGVASGTVSATNVYRLAGAKPFAVATVLDVAKGMVAVSLVKRRGPAPTVLAAGLVVTGHNWSPFLRGGGGRGVLPGAGALLAADPRGAALLAGGVAAGRLGRNTALGCFVAEALLVPVLAAGKGRGGALLGAAVFTPMLLKRVLGNSRPDQRRRWQVYGSRLLFDRDDRAGAGQTAPAPPASARGRGRNRVECEQVQ